MSGFISGLNQFTAGVNAVGATANSVARLARDVGSLATLGYLAGGVANGLGPWASGLQPASWRGVPFAVRNSTIRRGRRIAVHEYPFRDDVWVEDLGKGTRVVSFTGFLVGDDVFDQRDQMLEAAETPGPGDLVHPSLGSVTASLTEFSAGERFDLGRVVEIEFAFIQAGQDDPVYPSDDADTQDGVDGAAFEADSAATSDYGAVVANPLLVGADAINSAVRTVNGFTNLTANLVNDGARVVRSVNGIAQVVGGDAYFGRYSGGTRSSAPLVTIDRTLSLINRTDAAVLGMTSAAVNATQAVGLAGASVAGLAEAL